jgi:phosphatidylinositol-3,4,5-trisphosphate 3-phosphatase and dual-specificity protein phosphatase PTEN
MDIVEKEGMLDVIESTKKEDAAAAATGASNTAAIVVTPPIQSSSSDTPISQVLYEHSSLSDPASRATLESVLALHTQRRMQAPKSPTSKQKQGVSIPSQRRWLRYWSQILSGSAPVGFWSLNSCSTLRSGSFAQIRDKVRISSITVRMKEPAGAKGQVVKVANVLLDQVSNFKSSSSFEPPKPTPSASDGPVWISLAKYDDVFVETLERWEVHTRHSETPGRRRVGSDHMESSDVDIDKLFEDEKWDRSKMIRRFAAFGISGEASKGVEVENGEVPLLLPRESHHSQSLI